MTKTCKCSLKKLFLYIIIFSLFEISVFCNENQELKQWTIGAEKFSVARGQVESSVTEGISETIPKNILESINQALVRNIQVDEKLERTAYDLRTKRQALYLQLSSEYRKKDSLFLNYTGNKLKKEIEKQEKKIKDIEKQIDENLEQLKKAQEEIKNHVKVIPLEKKEDNSEMAKTANFFKSIITNEKAVFSSENIKIYGGNSENLVTISDKAKEIGYDGPLFEKEVYGKGINGLITGNITGYGEYISVAVDLYLYPGAKKIGSVMEIGSLNDLELITSSIVSQLIPIMTNSMPVYLYFDITPTTLKDSVKIYIDDVLQKTDGKKLIINSGVHTLKISSKGYKQLSTNYYFEGNTKYSIQVNMVPKNEGSLIVELKQPMIGQLYSNGVLAQNLNDKQSKIVINGTQVLGQFIAEDGKTSFYYIPEELYTDGNGVRINPKPEDRTMKIDKRRRWMYGAYSAFMISLIPTFITKGEFNNQLQLYSNGQTPLQTAKNWQIASNVCLGVSIGAGVFWVVELVRYLIAANSVLPEEAKEIHLMDLSNSNVKQEEKLIEEKNVDGHKEKSKETESGDKK